MSKRLFWLTLVVCCVGCVAPGEKGAQIEQPVAFSQPYDVVWRAAVDALETRFEIAKRDYEKGLIVTRYREGRTLLEPWGLDAQDTYGRFEETLNTVRRRCEARITRQGETATIQLTITRERLNYEPPPTDHAVGPPQTEAEREELLTEGTYAPKELWTATENDEPLARRLLEDISQRISDLEEGKPLSEVKPL